MQADGPGAAHLGGRVHMADAQVSQSTGVRAQCPQVGATAGQLRRRRAPVPSMPAKQPGYIRDRFPV